MKCVVGDCLTEATKGFTTCVRHRAKEKTIIRAKARVRIDHRKTGWTHPCGSHGESGILLEYALKPSCYGHLYGLVEHFDGSKVWYQVEWIVRAEDFVKDK